MKPEDFEKGEEALAKYGDELLDELLERDYDKGGRAVLILGPQGSGKTTALFQLALMARRMGDTVVIAGRYPQEQIHKIPNWEKRVVMYHYQNDEFHIWRVKHGVSEEITSKLEVKTYKNARDFIRKLDREKLNVVYPPVWYPTPKILVREVKRRYIVNPKVPKYMGPSAFWYEFFLEAIFRKDDSWITIALDEADDYFGVTGAGFEYWLLRLSKDVVKDFRKSRTNLYAAVHNLSDMNWQVNRKFMTFILLRGARVPAGTVVYPMVPLKLEVGEAIIISGRFGLIKIKPLLKPNYSLFVELESKEEPLCEENTKRSNQNIKEEILRLMEERGPYEALIKLNELKRSKMISTSHYHRLKNLILPLL